MPFFQISANDVADEVRVAIPDERWERRFGRLSARQMAGVAIALAKRFNPACFRKQRRSPKQPRTKRTRFRKKTPVSTARILARSRGMQLCKQ